ncbi:C39 family peptidase [Arabiibacter massiliensis]|uniref:C39 family peptidase n=1 Tax=Arabiibacter massiliensis TaxID=1870985 RepID=UPI0009B9DBA0|nr:C39 family peptidase [Arabiibacter massiliensis]
MSESEARERARRRLEERQTRLHGGAAGPSAPGRRPPNRAAPAGRRSREAQGPEGLPALADAAAGVLRAIGPKRLAIGATALALLIALVMGVRGCLSAGDGAAVPEEPAPAPAAQQPDEAKIDEAVLSSILGDELAAQLVQAASASDDVAWIASHPDAYAADGEAVQRKLLKLAAVEPEAVPFVRAFPEAYPAEDAAGTGDPSAGEVPRLYQWDPRWGATVYSSTTFALTGCCPTSLSMVYQGLTGKGDLSPYDMGRRAAEGGYETQYDGTDASFLVNEAAGLGLTCESLSVDADALRAALEGGAAVICNVGPGDFTEAGHFFVITGIAEDGALSINDPYSAERSKRGWDVGDVLGQTMALYAYRLA